MRTGMTTVGIATDHCSVAVVVVLGSGRRQAKLCFVYRVGIVQRIANGVIGVEMH